MFNITPSEFLIIALLALVVLGPERLPDMARSLGRLINKARDLTAELRESVDSISDDPAMKPLKDLGELATRPREKLAQFAAEAEAEEKAARAARAAQERAELESAEAEPAGAEPAGAEPALTEQADSEHTHAEHAYAEQSPAAEQSPTDEQDQSAEQHGEHPPLDGSDG